MKGLSDDLGSDALDDRADLIPMIDCVFLMLLFFVVTATFSDQSLFQVEMPTAVKAEVRDTTSATVISISKAGAYAIGQDLVAQDDLGKVLRKRQEAGVLNTLVISGDKGCPYDQVVAAVDAAHAVGVTEIAFAVGQ
jgi:biopolymer transport protein ExbD